MSIISALNLLVIRRMIFNAGINILDLIHHDDRKKALVKVKTLGGLIPICSSCKKIRGSKGYWNQIDVYIHEYSEIESSHGIRPEYSDKLYENKDWHIKMKNGNPQKSNDYSPCNSTKLFNKLKS